MKSSHQRLLALLTVTSGALCALGWAAALLWSVPPAWPLRAGLVVAGLAWAGLSVVLGRQCLRAEQLAVMRHFDALCRLDPGELGGKQPGDVFDNVPPLASRSPWRGVADRLREKLAEYGRELDDLKHARLAVEIRSQRAVSQVALVKSILAGISDPILAIDDFDRLMLANPAATALFDFNDATEDTERRAVAELVRCEKLVELLTSTAQRNSDAVRNDEIEVVDAEGQSRWYRATATRLACRKDGPDASAQGTVAVLRDIAHQKALQKRNAEFVSAVSHEMKAPLAGIKAYVELLADGEAEDEATREEFLTVIDNQADRLQRLVENLLNIARIEAGVVQVNKESRSLNEVLDDALGVVKPAAEAKEITLTADLSPLYLGVLADRDMLLQSAINLLSNAVKYTPQGGRVTLRSRLVDNEVTFEVEDTGVGMNEEDCRRVFEKFYRVAKDKNMAAGTGLGLPLAKHIVEDVHGGRLRVESTPGAGSTFTVCLPQAG